MARISAGRLQWRVAIERRRVETTPAGDPREVWETLLPVVHADVIPMRGYEANRGDAPGWSAHEERKVIVRWRRELADLGPTDSVVIDGKRLMVKAVHEVERRAVLHIITSERVD